MKSSFLLINGKVIINDSILKFEYRFFKYFVDFLKFCGGLSLIALFYEKINNYNTLKDTWEIIKLGIIGVASIYLIYLFTISFFKKVWINKIEINDLTKMIIDKNEDEKDIDEDSKIDITLIKNNGREKKIEFQKEQNKLESFLKEIKKKSSIIIEYIEE